MHLALLDGIPSMHTPTRPDHRPRRHPPGGPLRAAHRQPRQRRHRADGALHLQPVPDRRPGRARRVRPAGRRGHRGAAGGRPAHRRAGAQSGADPLRDRAACATSAPGQHPDMLRADRRRIEAPRPSAAGPAAARPGGAQRPGRHLQDTISKLEPRIIVRGNERYLQNPRTRTASAPCCSPASAPPCSGARSAAPASRSCSVGWRPRGRIATL
jgi:hypothetical protein